MKYASLLHRGDPVGSVSVRRACLVAAGLVLASLSAPAPAHAQGLSPEVQYVPDNQLPQGVEVHERTGDVVALDVPMLDQDGKPRTLRDLLAGGKPVLLTFNYSACPGLCSVHLNRLVQALGHAHLSPGSNFRLVTVVLAPEETQLRTQRTRKQYLDKLAEDGAKVATDDGWTFLMARPGDGDKGIKAIADSVGFGYRKVQGLYAHPATVVALAASGTITRYVHGIELTGDDLATTIVKAGLAEPSKAAGYVLTCFHIAPRTRNARIAREIMSIVGFLFAALLALGLAFYAWRRRKPSGAMTS